MTSSWTTTAPASRDKHDDHERDHDKDGKDHDRDRDHGRS